MLPTCPKCGAKVTEAMSFCPNCGTNLKPTPQPVEVAPAPAPAPMPPRQEKQEKQEKHEKGENREKGEKQEKGQFGFAGPVIAGVVLTALGIFFWLTQYYNVPPSVYGAYLFIFIGIVIIVAIVLGAGMASRRHPPA